MDICYIARDERNSALLAGQLSVLFMALFRSEQITMTPFKIYRETPSDCLSRYFSCCKILSECLNHRPFIDPFTPV